MGTKGMLNFKRIESIRNKIALTLVAAVALSLTSCSTSPIKKNDEPYRSGRDRLVALDESRGSQKNQIDKINGSFGSFLFFFQTWRF